MPHRETTIEAWTLPNLGTAFERKFALTPYVSERSFTIDYSAGGGGSLSVAREFPKFDEFVHVDSTNHLNDVGSIVRINKDGAPVTHYLARRFEDNVDPKATKLPVTLQSLDFFLDRAGVGPYDHDPLDDANSPNPTLDPDWEYGAESILRILGNEFANEVQRIWRGSTINSGDFTLTDGTDTTDPIAWDASASVIRTRLETDIASIVNVIVRGDGSLKTPWEVEFTDPAGDIPYTLAVTNNTTGGAFSTDTVRTGGTLDPSPWHRSYNAVTKTEHGNYQAFEVMHRDDVPAGLQAASTDEYFLRINLDSVADAEDYGGAQIIANVAPGSVYRASVPVWADGASYDFRLVLRHLDEAHIANGGDQAVPADTLWTLNIDPFKFGNNTNEIVYRIGILETTDIGDVYIAFQSAILAPGFDEEYLGKIMNDLLVPINARGLLTWVTPTWTDTLDSAGNVWDQKLQWTISHRQSILQLVEFAKEWGYESSGIYWSVANSRFQWDLFNPGGGGQVVTTHTITTGDIEGTSPVMHRLPGASSSWAFGKNGAWGRYEDTDLLATVGRLEVMDLDRQSRDNLAIHAQERINAEKESASGQRLRLRTDRFTVFVDMSPGDFVEVNLGPRFINAVYRIAGVTDVVDENGNEYQEVHVGTLVKSASTAETDTVRELYRKFESLGESRERGGVVDPSQQVIPASGKLPFLVAAYNSPQEYKDMAAWVCEGLGNDDVQIQAAIDLMATSSTFEGTVYLAPGNFFVRVDPDQHSLTLWGRVSLANYGIGSARFHQTVSVEPWDVTPEGAGQSPRAIIDIGFGGSVRGIEIWAWQNTGTDNLVAVEMAANTQLIDCAIYSDNIGALIYEGSRIDNCVFWENGNDYVGLLHHGVQGVGWDWSITRCQFQEQDVAIYIPDAGPSGGAARWKINDNFFQWGNVSILVEKDSVTGGLTWGGQYFASEIRGNFFQSAGTLPWTPSVHNGGIHIIGDHADQSPIEAGDDVPTDYSACIIADNRFEDYNGEDFGAIHLVNTRYIKVHDNEMVASIGHGIVLDGSVTAQVHHNSIMGVQPLSPEDQSAILLTGSGGYNRIEANVISETKSGANTYVWLYGINIDTANQVGNLVIGNDLRHIPGATLPLRDLGTSTELSHAADATYGDNWT